MEQSNPDYSLIIAIAALLFSVASPVISEWLRGRFSLKQKELDAKINRETQNRIFYSQHRAEVIESFIRSAGQVIKSHTRENYAQFGACSGEIYLYLDKKLWGTVDLIRSYIQEENWQQADSFLEELCKDLSDEKVRSEYEPEPES